ncbi:hypothetical protein Nepgr_033151 [Nepenthes gracilis]|uniref:DUF4378 domain-containing protein n=1 Tax=Nepenthes gracilis TaxID=150966 RepID=A0AAD3TJZ7_NEPGR|nr:hypothetical protein Nepgr_033151 [Nepenthes gracilis]
MVSTWIFDRCSKFVEFRVGYKDFLNQFPHSGSQNSRVLIQNIGKLKNWLPTMAKKSRRRASRYEKNQSSCMWGLISIFDFRHVRSSQKLLRDRKRGSKHIIGEKSKLDVLNNSSEIHEDIKGVEQSETTTDAGKMSVKELMDEEMTGDHDQKKLAEGLASEKPGHRKHKSTNSLDTSLMMEEFCCHTRQKNLHCFKHDRDIGHSMRSNKDYPITDQELEEATKVIVDHLTNEKSFVSEGRIKPSKEFVDALQILNSTKEVFMKNAEKLQDSWVEKDGKLKYFLEKDLGNAKQKSFFWRTLKGLERSLSKKNENSRDSNRTVVLNPAPINDHIESVSYNFSITEFRRRLKHAMRKDQSLSDIGGMPSSPSRDHFFIERIPKPFAIVKRQNKLGKPKDSKINFIPERPFIPDLTISDINIEAKKHLAEIVGSSDADVNFMSSGVAESLGRILSFPKYTSPINADSPRSVNMGQEGELCVNLGQDISNDRNCDDEFCKTFHSVEDQIHSEGTVDVEIIRSSDASSLLQKGLDISCEPCISCVGGHENFDDIQHCKNEQFSSLELDKLEEDEPSSTPMALPSDCSHTKEVDDLECIVDREEHPSPNSVLEPVFIEDDFSRSSSKSLPVAELIQPLQIQFEEQIHQSSVSAARYRTRMDSNKSILDFVKMVVQKSALTWDELLEVSLLSDSLLSDHILDPSLFDEVEFSQDQRLLFDLIDEVLSEACWHNFGSLLSFSKPSVQLKLKGKDVIAEIWEGIEWHLQLPRPHGLDEVLANDYLKSRIWMDSLSDTESFVIEMEEGILDDLMEDTIRKCINGG